jgi:Protein of unknown function (DUF559)
MAAVLTCGLGAVLSHGSAGALWGIVMPRRSPIDVLVPVANAARRPRIAIRRSRILMPADITRHDRIPVTTPVRTLIDLATQLSAPQIERAINEADKLDLIHPEGLRAALDERAGQRGVAKLRAILDRATFVLTDTELEAKFVPVALRAGLPPPLTQRWVDGFKVDFYWPELRLVVETDGLRYHRTPAQQARDRLRDQAHVAAGLTALRFTHAQVAYEPGHVEETLRAVARRLAATRAAPLE